MKGKYPNIPNELAKHPVRPSSRACMASFIFHICCSDIPSKHLIYLASSSEIRFSILSIISSFSLLWFSSNFLIVLSRHKPSQQVPHLTHLTSCAKYKCTATLL